MSDHSELVAEIASVEKMTTPDRLKHAKKRRNQQMKRWANYERQLEKESSKKRKQSSNQRGHGGRKRRVKFIHNIMLLEAAARNDIDEGIYRSSGFLTRSDTNRAAQPLKIASDLKFRI